MVMIKGYNPDSERGYNAPEAPRIVEPERMMPKIPGWIYPILYAILGSYLLFNTVDFFMTKEQRTQGMSKSEIEERRDEDYNTRGGLVKFLGDDFLKPGRELAYLIWGDGEPEK